MLSWFGLGVTIALLPGLANGTEPQAESAATGTPRISVNVDLVVLPPTVRNRSGRLVSDLRKQDFNVYSLRPKLPDVIEAVRHSPAPPTLRIE